MVKGMLIISMMIHLSWTEEQKCIAGYSHIEECEDNATNKPHQMSHTFIVKKLSQ